jgi:hypothetical protein
MQESNANRNPEWDAVLGDDTMTGTFRLLCLIVLFIVIGGSLFHFVF